MEKNISNSNLTNLNRVETIFDACKYRGCTNRRLTKTGGVHLFRFPSRGDTRLLAWIKNSGNKLILNWSLSTLRKAGICGDHFSNDSFLNSERSRLKSTAIPEPYKEPDSVITTNEIWDHTYCKDLEIAEKEKNEENIVEIDLGPNSEHVEYKWLEKVDEKSHKVVKLLDGRPPWRSNPTFIKTYSRKLSFKDSDDAMEWTAIEPASAEDNVGELRASEELKKTVDAVKTAAADALVHEHENREIRELRMINMELRRQNKKLRIENFKLQLRLATATQSKGER